MTDDKENINEEKTVSDQVVNAKLDELTSEGENLYLLRIQI